MSSRHWADKATALHGPVHLAPLLPHLASYTCLTSQVGWLVSPLVLTSPSLTSTSPAPPTIVTGLIPIMHPLPCNSRWFCFPYWALIHINIHIKIRIKSLYRSHQWLELVKLVHLALGWQFPPNHWFNLDSPRLKESQWNHLESFRENAAAWVSLPDSDLIGPGCGLAIESFKSSLGDSPLTYHCTDVPSPLSWMK